MIPLVCLSLSGTFISMHRYLTHHQDDSSLSRLSLCNSLSSLETASQLRGDLDLALKLLADKKLMTQNEY